MLLFCYGTTLGLPTIAIPYLSQRLTYENFPTGSINLIMVLTYVAEITEPHLRGMLSATASMTTIFGTVSQLFLGSFVHWRTAAILNLMFPIMALIVLYFIPESPHWLISKGRMSEASASLCWLRGWVTPDEVQPELSQITKAIEDSALKRLGKDGQKRPNYRMYMRRTFLLPYSLVTALFFIGQFGGMTALQTYAVGIFESIQAPVDPYLATLLLGLAELSGALLCVVLIHYTGKRPLALISTAGSALCFLVVAVYAQNHLTHGWNSPLVPTVLLLFAAFLTHICIRLLPWMLIGEVFPNNIRATASGMSSSSSYVFASAVNKLYYPMLDTFNLSGTLYFYSAISLLGTLYMYKMMPETEGRTLSDIEEHFADKSKTFVTNIERSAKKKKEGVKKIVKGDEVQREKDVEKVESRENRSDVDRLVETEKGISRMKAGIGELNRMEEDKSVERRDVRSRKNNGLSGNETKQDGMNDDHVRSIEKNRDEENDNISSADNKQDGMNDDHVRSIEENKDEENGNINSADNMGVKHDQNDVTDGRVNSIGMGSKEDVSKDDHMGEKEHHMGLNEADKEKTEKEYRN
ncbi:hypothetical protein WDU94_002491 [Cyamophila willieti]